MSSLRKYIFWGMAAYLFTLPIYVFPAGAGCAPGLPCVIGATPNNPATLPNETNAGPNAAKIDGNNACDADFMNQIYAKSFLEATRENIMNEVVVRRPDSVLEYTCFDQFAKLAGVQAPPIFSETTNWHPKNVFIGTNPGFPPALPPIGSGVVGLIPLTSVDIDVFMGSGRLTTRITNIILNGLATYINSNFAHDFLGRANGSGIDYAPGGAAYACSYMDNVYFLAKCVDFNVDDPFLSFRTLVTTDPRTDPIACGGGTKITNPVIDVAENVGHAYATFDDVTPTYLTYMTPAPCLTPIPTGVFVQRELKSIDALGNATLTFSTGYPDKFCPNPSCYYDNSSDRCLP